MDNILKAGNDENDEKHFSIHLPGNHGKLCRLKRNRRL